jgi:transposase
LMRSGMTNTAACKILGVSRRTGVLIRARYRRQTAVRARPAPSSGRYLSLHERLRIADLLRLGCSMRAIAAELGRSPSTIKRELDRHRDEHGRYLPGATGTRRSRPAQALLPQAAYRPANPQVPLADPPRTRRGGTQHEDDRPAPTRG